MGDTITFTIDGAEAHVLEAALAIYRQELTEAKALGGPALDAAVLMDGAAMKASEAHRLGCCVRCRIDVNPRDMSVIDQNEWNLSGLCPDCYEAVMPVDEDCE